MELWIAIYLFGTGVKSISKTMLKIREIYNQRWLVVAAAAAAVNAAADAEFVVVAAFICFIMIDRVDVMLHNRNNVVGWKETETTGLQFDG